MQMLQGLIAATILATPATAATTDWWVASSVSAAQYVDLGMIETSGGWLRARQVMVYRVASPETRVKRIDTLAEFDCGRRIIRYRTFRSLDAANTILTEVSEPDRLAEHGAAPGTLSGKTIDFVCGTDRAGAVRVADPQTDRF